MTAFYHRSLLCNSHGLKSRSNTAPVLGVQAQQAASGLLPLLSEDSGTLTFISVQVYPESTLSPLLQLKIQSPTAQATAGTGPLDLCSQKNMILDTALQLRPHYKLPRLSLHKPPLTGPRPNQPQPAALTSAPITAPVSSTSLSQTQHTFSVFLPRSLSAHCCMLLETDKQRSMSKIVMRHLKDMFRTCNVTGYW